MSQLERIRSSPIYEPRRNDRELSISGSSSIHDYDPHNTSQISVSKSTKDDNYLASVSQKRAFSQPMITGSSQPASRFNFRKTSADFAGYGSSGPKAGIPRRSTAIGSGRYDISPQISKSSSTNVFRDKSYTFDEGAELGPAFESYAAGDNLDDSKRGSSASNRDSFYFRDYSDLGIATGSALKNSKNNNNNNNNSNNNSNINNAYDTEYPRQVDKIPSVQPTVNYQDKLWTQIDVLDDVKKMSNEAIENNSFFTPQYENNLKDLKKTQMNLLTSVKKLEKKLDSSFDQKKVWFEFDIDLDRLKELKYLYNKDYFENVQSSIEDVRKKLDDVSRLMKTEENEECSEAMGTEDNTKDTLSREIMDK
ncbi:hypothetical protein DASC09_045390 [Saccharomycopsis crataegensis]|uniref:Uncharacterized protein n=1 Tax=Saccharomycopsis crataegensis TaxID=43959 RepID=A0AAV5QRY1_9ASCO|nr:hypothetical protein DASC09_045390 [Saccharomycopsis crataegensis]